ncbi:MAG TPA: 4Fe-4S binding protein [Syntrophorhabdus sp.]|nr:4Fe-4S binding protein [Syntrophorhabdus sp.]HQO63956.1 4Fe-4S binding protein [Syntrophorhabdus sp.]
MGHHTARTAYKRLVDRLNRYPQGAPPSELLFKILKILFSEKEADLVSRLPIKPFTAEKASAVWKMDPASTQKVLDELAGRAILVDIDQEGRSVYALPPPMAGFFEFSLMRVRNDIDQKALSELFFQYLNVEEDFIRELLINGETLFGRTFVHEPALSHENSLHVLEYERSSEVIKNASQIAVGLCYCRHKMHHIDRACNAPLDICMTFDNPARSLVKHGFAREVDAIEGLDLLQKAYGYGLVQFGENVRENVDFICNCCRCCCEGLIAARRFAGSISIHTTNFIPEIDENKCSGCGNCIKTCPVDAMTFIPSVAIENQTVNKASLDKDLCLGCGLCVRSCARGAIRLQQRQIRVITPVDGVHRIVMMAIERGKLQDLIFDNQVLWSHRILAGVLGAILKLPPIKQALASRQIKSRYLETLIRFMKTTGKYTYCSGN